uniref:Ubiquitin specific peptidase 19 n=1 Tax=Nomascus leucogenys TaxID=61853 RepID=A0A2I3GYD0_NOMLE
MPVPEGPGPLGPWGPQDWVGPLPRGPTTPDEGCLRYFVLGTVAALVALVLNVFYPLVSQSRWR